MIAFQRVQGQFELVKRTRTVLDPIRYVLAFQVGLCVPIVQVCFSMIWF